MARKFTEAEKEKIRAALIRECELSWSKFGYVKTNIGELCKKVGISKGAFYLFYSSKEELFCDVLDYIQDNIFNIIKEELSKNPTKEGFLQVMFVMFEQYVHNNFLHNVKSEDFMTFVNRLPKNRIKKHEFASIEMFQLMRKKANIKFSIDEIKAFEIISFLLSLATIEEFEDGRYTSDKFEMFEFMTRAMFEKIVI